MKRTTPLRRSSPLPRGETRIKRVNAKRKGSRFPKRRDPAYCAWIRTLPCVIGEANERWFLPHTAAVGCAGPVECAHVKSRGAGGDDVANTVPLCRRHHRQQHDLGVPRFQNIYDLDLAMAAAFRAPTFPRSAP